MTWCFSSAVTIRLHLVVMYVATWRNTFLKYIRELLKKREGCLRVVLPDPSGKSGLLRLYASRLGIEEEELRGRIKLAIKDFRALAEYGKVEVYCSKKYFNHAMYLFDASGVLAFYAFERTRTATPAILVEDGWFFEFLRKDFDYLVTKARDTVRLA